MEFNGTSTMVRLPPRQVFTDRRTDPASRVQSFAEILKQVPQIFVDVVQDAVFELAICTVVVRLAARFAVALKMEVDSAHHTIFEL